MSHLLAKFDSVSELTTIIKNLPVPFEITNVAILNEGYDNISIEVNDEWIFRFPKKPDVPTEREIQLLNMLKGKFHVKIPEIEFVFQDPIGIGYRKILGGELTIDYLRSLSESRYQKLVDDIAQFFADLHSAISLEEARAIGIEDSFSKNYIDVIKERLLPALADSDIRTFAQTCLSKFDQLSPADHLVVLHTDLSPDNMAFEFEKEQLNGVFDFSDVAIGDLNLEFVHLWKFDPVFAKQITESYSKKTGRTCDLERTKLYKQLNMLADFAFQFKNEEIYQSYVDTIRGWMNESV